MAISHGAAGYISGWKATALMFHPWADDSGRGDNYVDCMQPDALDLVYDELRLRGIFAAMATYVGIATIVTRSDPEVTWPIIGTTLAVFWAWAVIVSFPRAPVYLMGLSGPIALNLVEQSTEISMFIIVLTVAILASYEQNRAVVAGIIGIVLTSIAVLSWSGAFTALAWPNWLFATVFAWGAGEVVYRFRSAVGELQHTRGLVADQAAVHERRRIARDVHDLVGHSLSVVMLHISGARHLVHKNPNEAERALEQAEQAGRQSLAEIRRTVGLLRDESDPDSPVLPSSDLSDVADLVQDFALAGLNVTLDLSGPIDHVDPTTALAGFRIAQEALTNASRHAIGAQVEVTVHVLDDRCDVTVVNRGGESIRTTPGSGFGLISMRERAKSVGGSLIAGPTPLGWSVEATLPVGSDDSDNSPTAARSLPSSQSVPTT